MPPPIEKPIAYVVFCTTLARACTSATAARKKPTSSTEPMPTPRPCSTRQKAIHAVHCPRMDRTADVAMRVGVGSAHRHASPRAGLPPSVQAEHDRGCRALSRYGGAPMPA